MSKRIFSLLTVVFCTVLWAAEEPIMRVAVITDTHVKEKPESAALVHEASKLFRQHKVDVVINCGDIADHYNEKAYKHYRNAVAAAYGREKLPVEFFAYANHDLLRLALDAPGSLQIFL